MGHVAEGKIQKWPKDYNGDVPNVTFAQYVFEKLALLGDDVACIDSERKVETKYSDFEKRAKPLAASLQTELNLQPNAVVAIALPMCTEYVISFLAVNLCGASAVLTNPLQTLPELQHAVKLTKPTLWIGLSMFLGRYEEIYANEADRPLFVSIDGEGCGNGSWGLLPLLKAGIGKEVNIVNANPLDSVAAILFSSGTTGVPKGVMLTNRNLIATRRQSEELGGFPRSLDNCMVMYMPPYHSAAFNITFECLARGLRFVIISRYTMERLLTSIQEFKVNILFLVPSIANQLVKQPVEERYDLSSLRSFYSGTAPIGMETIEALKQKFGCPLYEMYGMTETTMRSHGNESEFHRDGSVGVPLPFTEVKVIDLKSGEVLGPREEGEIYVRGAIVMKGYLGDDESTKQTIDSDGWLHTGDIGYYDDDGYFFITGRAKELIKFKGHQVSPSELEQILLTHPGVLDVAVGPVPDEIAGELPRAYIVRKPEAGVEEEAILQFVADRVSAYKRLRGGVKFVDAIPKTQTGKVMRSKLRDIN